MGPLELVIALIAFAIVVGIVGLPMYEIVRLVRR